jgi:hypothetical protein
VYFKVLKGIYVRYEWTFLIISAFLSEHKFYFYTMVVMCFVHEMCHFFVAYALNVKVNFFIVHVFGFELGTDSSTYKNDIAVSAAGPLGSAVLLILGIILKDAIIISANFSLLLVNLIPALPLDGGRLLKIILLRNLGYAKTCKLMRKMAIICGVLLLSASYYIRTWWLFAIGLLVLFYKGSSEETGSCIIKDKKNLPVKIFEAADSIEPYQIINLASPYYRIGIKIRGENKITYEEEIINQLQEKL